MKELFGYIDSFIANSGSIRISFAEGMWPKGSITESMVSPAGFIYWLVAIGESWIAIFANRR
jgi:hypothetical protein